MSNVVEAIRLIGWSTVATTSPKLVKDSPFTVRKFVVVNREGNGKADLSFAELKQLLASFGTFTPVLFTDSQTILEACDELVDLKPAVVVLYQNGSTADGYLELLFGKKLLTSKGYSLYSRLNTQGFDSFKVDEFEMLVELHKHRKFAPDFTIANEQFKFAKDQARLWLYEKLDLEDFVYRLNGQNYKILRNSSADKNRLLSLVNEGLLVCDAKTRQLLLELSLEPPVSIANAPFIEPSLLARFAALADSRSVIKRDSGEQIPVTVLEGLKYEHAEVLTVLEDGTVEFAQVLRTHRKLCAYLPQNIQATKHAYTEDEAGLMASEFELPDIPTVADIAPDRLNRAYETIETIESIIAERTGHKLMKFQRDDLARLLAKGFGILAWDPGLGKTLGGLVFALGAVAMGLAKPRVLIVAPQDLTYQWLREVRKFFGEDFASEFIIVSNYADALRLRQLSKLVPKHIPLYAITWYEVLRSVPYKEVSVHRADNEVCPICKSRVYRNHCSYGCPLNGGVLLKARDAAFWLKDFVRDGVLIVDEATYAKSDDSKRGIATRRLVTARCRLLLTGTPIKNLLSDLPMLLQLAAKPNSDAYPFPAESEGVTKFSRQFMVVERNLLTGRKRLAPEPTNIAVAQKLLSGIIVRRTKDQTGEEIVPLTIQVHKVPLTASQLAWYKAWCDDEVFEQWFIETHDKPLHPLAKLLSRMAHLLFVTSHPTSPTATGAPIKLSNFRHLPEPSEQTHKNQLVINLAENAYRETGHCVVFVQTVGVIPTLASELKRRKVPVHLAVEVRANKVQSLPPARRGTVIKQFEETGGVLFASLSAMSHGHDLAFVSRAVMHSLCFAYDNYAQAIMRVHRIISERPVEVHVICAANTLDEYLLDLLRRKDFATKTVLNASVLEKSISITPEEWRKLWEQVVASVDSIQVAEL